MAKVFDRTQLSSRRVALVLERMGVDTENFASEYQEIRVPRSRKNRLTDLSDVQIESIRELLKDRTPEAEEAVMFSLNIKTRTTLDRVIADFAASVV